MPEKLPAAFQSYLPAYTNALFNLIALLSSRSRDLLSVEHAAKVAQLHQLNERIRHVFRNEDERTSEIKGKAHRCTTEVKKIKTPPPAPVGKKCDLMLKMSEYMRSMLRLADLETFLKTQAKLTSTMVALTAVVPVDTSSPTHELEPAADAATAPNSTKHTQLVPLLDVLSILINTAIVPTLCIYAVPYNKVAQYSTALTRANREVLADPWAKRQPRLLPILNAIMATILCKYGVPNSEALDVYKLIQDSSPLLVIKNAAQRTKAYQLLQCMDQLLHHQVAARRAYLKSQQVHEATVQAQDIEQLHADEIAEAHRSAVQLHADEIAEAHRSAVQLHSNNHLLAKHIHELKQHIADLENKLITQAEAAIERSAPTEEGHPANAAAALAAEPQTPTQGQSSPAATPRPPTNSDTSPAWIASLATSLKDYGQLGADVDDANPAERQSVRLFKKSSKPRKKPDDNKLAAAIALANLCDGNHVPSLTDPADIAYDSHLGALSQRTGRLWNFYIKPHVPNAIWDRYNLITWNTNTFGIIRDVITMIDQTHLDLAPPPYSEDETPRSQ